MTLPSCLPPRACHHPERFVRLLGLLLSSLLLLLLIGCTVFVEPATSTPEPPQGISEDHPTPLSLATSVPPEPHTPLPPASHTATVTPQPQPTAISSPAPTDTPAAAPSPAMAKDWGLVYLRDGTIYRADYWGNDARPVAEIGLASMVALWQQQLAYADLSALCLLDLDQGDVRKASILSADPTSSFHFVWASDGRALVYALNREDSQAPTFGRSIDIGRMDISDGQFKPLLTLHDRPGAALLSFDGPAEEFLLVPRGGDPAFTEIWLYDALTGTKKGTLEVEGDGAGIASPDGRRLLTTAFDNQTDTSQIRVYDLSDSSASAPAIFRHAPNTHSAGHVWAPDGTKVAFLLRDGRSYWDNVTRGLGLWVLDTTTLKTQQITDEAQLGSGPVGWTPDGEWIVCFHADPEGGSYYYALRPDGTDRHLMTLGPQVRLVGWVPAAPRLQPTGVETPRPQSALTEIEELFRQALSDPSLLPEGAAAFLSLPEIISMDDGQATAYLSSILTQAGWEFPVAAVQGVNLKRPASDLAVLKLPPNLIYLFWPGGWQRASVGDLIEDARLIDDELGIIFAHVGASSINPAFTLLRRQPAGGWESLWSPSGQREWICTDGSISFVGEGLSQLRLVGSSFALDAGKDQVFSECHACPHRTLVSTWERLGNEYVRRSTLPSDAPRAERLWEMTEPSPYASLYEFTRRLRVGDQGNARSLAASDAVIEQALEHGLADVNIHLLVDSVEGQEIKFFAGDPARHLVAELLEQEGQWHVLSIAEVP